MLEDDKWMEIGVSRSNSFVLAENPFQLERVFREFSLDSTRQIPLVSRKIRETNCGFPWKLKDMQREPFILLTSISVHMSASTGWNWNSSNVVLSEAESDKLVDFFDKVAFYRNNKIIHRFRLLRVRFIHLPQFQHTPAIDLRAG